MNWQKLATIGCIILSIVFSVLFALFIHFEVVMPTVSNGYEKSLDYPEDLYKEYQEEAERMIVSHEYTCQYPAQINIYPENGRTTLIIQVGDYDEGFEYSNYVTATVKNFGTNEQEVTFERSRKSAEEAYESAERDRTLMEFFAVVFIYYVLIIFFTAYLINNSIKRRYSRVLYPISLIGICTVMIIAMQHLLLA